MSRVTNVILTAHVGLQDGSDPEINCVNTSLREADGGFGEFVNVSEKAGGTKYMECRVYLSAFNHADTETMLRAIDQAPGETRTWCRLSLRNRKKIFFGLGTAAAQRSDDECNGDFAILRLKAYKSTGFNVWEYDLIAEWYAS